MKFNDFNLSESLLAGLRDVNFQEPTPIQEQSIPISLEGKDLIATAQTGTGKTGAFVIPLMEKILKSEREGVKALILTPTRELATQIDQEIFAIGYHADISSATVIGGSDFAVQAKAIKAGVDIIIATPGRLMDQKKVIGIDFSNLEFLVLDEADRMLDMGFLPDIKKIISWLPEQRQTLLFSATMPNEIQRLASSIMKNPASVDIERAKPPKQVEQRAYYLRSNQKIPLVKSIFDDLTWESCIIFTSTKKGTDELQRLLKKEGIKAASIHGDRSQEERNKALNAFKNGQVPVIVATDVLARGIDIKGVSIIVNYDVPNNTDDYVHRIGRTGRYDKSGIAITFVTKRDRGTFKDILGIKGNTIKAIEVPSGFKNDSEFSWKDGFSQQTKKESTQKEARQQQDKRQKKDPRQKTEKKRELPKEAKKQHQEEKKRPKKQQHSKQEKAKDSEKSSQKSHHKDTGKSDHKIKEESKSPQRATSDQKTEQREKVILPPVIEKAVERNKRVRKPAKGFWGIIKSYIPTFKK